MADRDQKHIDWAEEDRQRRRLHLREPSVDDGDQPYDGVGAELRAARLRAEVAVDTVEQCLRIRRTYLEAIEEGRFDELPGMAYAIGFVRSYANLLDLDADTLVGRFKQETSVHATRTELVFPSPIPEGRLPGARLLVLSVVLVGAIYGVWYVVSNQDRVELDLVTEPPELLASELAPPPEAAGPPATDATVSRAVGQATASIMRGDETARAGPAETEEALGEAAPPLALSTDTAQPAIAAAPQPDRPAGAATRIGGRSQIGPSSSEFAALNSDGRPPQVAAPDEGPTEESARLRPGRSQRERAEAGQEQAERAPARADGGRESAQPAPRRTETLSAPAVDTAAIPTPPPAPPPQGAAAAGAATTQGYVPQVFGAGNAGSRVVVRALMDAWVQVIGAGDELLLTRILRAGDSYHPPNRRDLVLMTGNAGALEILVDGAAVLPLGPIGAVRRDVSLDPDQLLGATNPGPLLGEGSGQ